MSLNFDDLPLDLKAYISGRFREYEINGEQAYDLLLPDEIKIQGPEAIEAFFRGKDISHIFPQEHYPELRNEITNVFMEDETINQQRGANIAGEHEVYAARQDGFRDAYDGDINEDGILDFEPQYEQLALLNPKVQASEIAQASEIVAIEGTTEAAIADIAVEEGLSDSESILGEIAEGSVGGAAIGSAFSVAFYVALKTILSLEGARRRGEVTWVDVAEQTFAEVSRVLPMAVGVSLVIGIIAAIFGGWILIPLMPVAAYYGVKAPIKLFTSYWAGLDDSQQAEIKQLARNLGGKVDKWIRSLEADAKRDSCA